MAWVALAAWLPGLVAAQQVSAPTYPEEPNWQTVCTAAVAQPLPEAAARMAAEATPPPAHWSGFPVDGCDSEAAYYGFGKPPDYAAALRCAYRQRMYPDPSVGDSFKGPGTLAMLYANGYGVARDYGLALRFACEVGQMAAGAEMEGRIGRLEALRAGKLAPAKPFDLCDDATSGEMAGACEEHDQNFADAGRARRLAAVRARLPVAARGRLPALEAAETAFETARGKHEMDRSGTAARAFAQEDRGRLRDQFLINLQRFASGNLPAASGTDRARAREELENALAAVRSMPPPATSAEVQPQGVAVTEEAWEQLFAAWLRFLPVASPGLSQNAAATELLRLRTHQLRSLVPTG